MNSVKINSDYVSDFAKIMQVPPPATEPTQPIKTAEPARIQVDGEGLRNGLAQLVLAIIKLVHELLEKQAIRRMDGGSLTDQEIEQVGVALMRQSEEITHLLEVFNLREEDLNIDLGPLGKLLKE